jgi:hypothetical protein
MRSTQQKLGNNNIESRKSVSFTVNKKYQIEQQRKYLKITNSHASHKTLNREHIGDRQHEVIGRMIIKLKLKYDTCIFMRLLSLHFSMHQLPSQLS